MGDSITCMCGRPKWTPPDLKRWDEESLGKDPRAFNPDWAKAICWHNGIGKCPMKRVAP